MSIKRWDPLREMLTLRDAVDRLFAESFVRPRGEWLSMLREHPALDVYETDDAIKIEAALPGVKPEDVAITVTGNTVVIRGEKQAKEEVKEENYYRREVQYGSFSRSVTLPASADMEKGAAECKDGILTLTFPKVAEAQPKRIPVLAREST